MPDEAAALRVMFAAYQRLQALGFREAAYCPADGQLREFIEAGSTGIHTGYRDASGVWIAEAGDLWPSKPILYRDPTASGMEAAEGGRNAQQLDPSDDSPIGNAETPSPVPSASRVGEGT